MLRILYQIYDNFKLDFYSKLYADESTSRQDSLTVSESFCLEVISSFDDATVKKVADFMKISQPNAAFKISNLEKKGYIVKVQSTVDRRKFYLRETDKYYSYRKEKNTYIKEVMARLDQKMSPEDQKHFKKYMVLLLECMHEYSKLSVDKDKLDKILD